MSEIVIVPLAELKAWQQCVIEDTVKKTIEILNGQKDPEELIKVQDLAEQYNLSPQTLFDRIRARHIKTERIGKFLAVQWKHKDELLKKSA